MTSPALATVLCAFRLVVAADSLSAVLAITAVKLDAVTPAVDAA